MRRIVVSILALAGLIGAVGLLAPMVSAQLTATNIMDLTSIQTVTGQKTFAVAPIFPAGFTATGPISLPTGSITSAAILDGTIVAADLGVGSVTSAAILNGTIASADLGVGSVTSAAILDGAIAAPDLGAGSVTSAAILDGTVTGADLALPLVLSAVSPMIQMVNTTLTTDLVAASDAFRIRSTKDAAIFLDSDDNNPDTGPIGGFAVVQNCPFFGGPPDCPNVRVPFEVRPDGSIRTLLTSQPFIGTDADGDLIGAGTGVITSTHILDGTIVAADLSVGSVTSAAILDGTIAAADLGVGSVTSAAILDGTVTGADLALPLVLSTGGPTIRMVDTTPVTGLTTELTSVADTFRMVSTKGVTLFLDSDDNDPDAGAIVGGFTVVQNCSFFGGPPDCPNVRVPLEVRPDGRIFIRAGDVALLAPGEGIILKTPNGLACRKLTVSNTGAQVMTTVTCPS